MSELIKHECGIALVRLLKPLSFYKEKYGTWKYGLNKLYLLMEKQHNRGQDGAGAVCVKNNLPPGHHYISRFRSVKSNPIKDVFDHINKPIKKRAQKAPVFVFFAPVPDRPAESAAISAQCKLIHRAYRQKFCLEIDLHFGRQHLASR